jgi:twitching motility protein PilT
MVALEELLGIVVSRGASDLHISANSPPRIRIDGKLLPLDMEPLKKEDTQKLIYSLLTNDQIARFEKDLELDFSFGVEGLGRFRTNVLMQKGALGMVLRLIPNVVRSFEELGLSPKLCRDLCDLPKGLVLVTGATGSGKSTTIASMIEYIASTQDVHIITVEDPIEFTYHSSRALVNQREVGQDTHEFKNALRHILRQDPDVVLIGEMRDLETIEAALVISETGHLTFATLHTSDVVQTVNRIIDVFPGHQQQQVRTQLSLTLSACFCQQLVPKARGKGRALCLEVMLATPAVRNLMRENKVHQIYSVIQSSGAMGMRTMNSSLHDLYKQGQITYEDAISYSPDQDELKKLIQRG